MQGLEQAPHEVRAGDGNNREDRADRHVLAEAGVQPEEREHGDLRRSGDDEPDCRRGAGFDQREPAALHRSVSAQWTMARPHSRRAAALAAITAARARRAASRRSSATAADSGDRSARKIISSPP